MRKYILLLISMSAVAFLLYYIAESFSPGSYGDAYTYELPIPEKELIRVIKEFKKENPEFSVNSQTQLLDHRNNHWYVIYFYYPQEDEIIYTWTRPSGKDKTTFALVSVNDGKMTKWKDVKKDLTSTKSKEQIMRFENLILEKIKEKIKP